MRHPSGFERLPALNLNPPRPHSSWLSTSTLNQPAFPLSRRCEIVRCVDIEQFPRRQAYAPRGRRARELVEGEPTRFHLPCDEWQESDRQDDREGRLPSRNGKHRAASVEQGQTAMQGSRRNKWHITRQEEDGESFRCFQCRINPPQRSASPHQVFAYDSHRQPQPGGVFPDVPKQRAVAQTKARFGTPHSGTQSAREDAYFDGRRHSRPM